MNDKKWRILTKNFGNALVDLGKLSFGSLVLGSILKGGVDLFQLFLFGAAVAMLLFAIGIWFILMSED
jgi:hypothetical protein